MQPFTTHTGIAVPLLKDDINTDQVAPVAAMRDMNPDYKKMLFMRARAEEKDFVLNQPQFANPGMLVTGQNFGAGSSREAAVWALMAFGVRCVIAPSLGDIFHQNSLKNGLLPVILPAEVVADMRSELHARPGATITADLEAQTVTGPDGAIHAFTIESFAKHMLLTGQDEIGLTLSYDPQIRAFETRQRAETPWLPTR